MNPVTTELEVVERVPRWVSAAQCALGQHRNLSQEKTELEKEWILHDLFLQIFEVNWETKQRFIPMSEKQWEFLKTKDETAGSTCRWCPDPHTDGYRDFFPTRCNPCNTLNSYRYRGRQAALKLLAIKYSLDLESILWTFTFPIVSSNRPLEQDEIDDIAKERRRYISKRLFQDKDIWHDRFVGMNVMECVVTPPGETREARWWDDNYERTVNLWTYHIHGHYLILNPKESKVNLKLAYTKFGKDPDKHNKHSQMESMVPYSTTGGPHVNRTDNESCTVKMRLHYKHERDYDYRNKDSDGEVIGTRDEMKIMRDYLVGYARKDCLGKYSWVGDKTWRKVRTRVGDKLFDVNGNEIDVN